MTLMKEKIIKYLKEAFFFIALLFILSTALSLYRTSEMKIKDNVCKKGARIVYFWGSWCPVCKMTSPNVQRVSKRFNVLAVAVRSGDERQVRAYMQKEGLDFPLLNDKDAQIAQENGVDVYPTLVFCQNAKVKMTESGYMSTFGIWLRALLFT